MQKKLIFGPDLLEITVSRLCYQLIEVHGNFENTVILGMQPRGVYLAEMIHARLEKETAHLIPFGHLDTTFHRDDFRRRDSPAKANSTKVDFIIEGKNVILIDDVLYTGRSVRAALDAMMAFGRAESVELLVLIHRKYTRQLPIAPHYIGRQVNTIESQRVQVELEAQGFKKNKIWLIDKES